MLFTALAAFVFGTLLSLTTSAGAFNPTKLPLPARTIHQYPNPTWIENVSVRPNGNLLLTILSSHQLLELDPSDGNSTTLVYTFPGVNAVSGITEIADDVYLVAAGNFTGHSGQPGSWSFWKVDYACRSLDVHGGAPTIVKLLDVPEAKLPNGLSKLNSDTVLVADAGLNSTWTLKVDSLQYELAIRVPQMSPPASAELDEGVNGIHVLGDHLYWTNSEADTLYRIGIDLWTGKAARYARVEAVANVTTFIDDFTFDCEGRAWIATDSGNTLIVVSIDDKENPMYQTVDGSATSTAMEGSTSCAFGRRHDDRDILYVVTNGGLTQPVNGSVVEGGKVVAVDTRGF